MRSIPEAFAYENYEYEMVSYRNNFPLNSSVISKLSMENTNEEFNIYNHYLVTFCAE
jgi:hypothetical protein